MIRAIGISVVIHGVVFFSGYHVAGQMKWWARPKMAAVIYVAPVSGLATARPKKTGNKLSGRAANKAQLSSRKRRGVPYSLALSDLLGGSNQPPSYPDRALENGWEGQVKLRIDFQSDGEAASVRVIRSSGYGILDDAAVASASRWQLPMARRQGEPVVVEVPVDFRLVEEETEGEFPQ